MDQGVDLMPGADADGAVPRGAGQGEGLLRFGVGLAGVVLLDIQYYDDG